jgi:hypothetical protein
MSLKSDLLKFETTYNNIKRSILYDLCMDKVLQRLMVGEQLPSKSEIGLSNISSSPTSGNDDILNS